MGNEFQGEEKEVLDAEPENGKEKKGWKKELLEWIESLGIAVVVALLITNFVFTMVLVDGASMEPTLHDRNRIFAFRLGYQPKNGDIVFFKPVGDPKKYYIKRVIAVEGQTIDIKEGYVYLDGVKLKENYVADVIKGSYPGKYPKVVPKDCVFVMGDNRNNSRDSRDELGVGMVNKKTIAGKAMFRILPLSQIGSLYNN
jgi:signal peptidase I